MRERRGERQREREKGRGEEREREREKGRGEERRETEGDGEIDALSTVLFRSL